MSTSSDQHYVNRRVLKINVGFLLAEGVGYFRDMVIELPRVQLDDDLTLDFLRGNLRLSRNSRGVLVQGQLETHVLSECTRCLRPIFVPVFLEIEELFAFPPSALVAFSVAETGILDLAPLIREEAILGVPMVALCRPDCAGLCPQCGHDLNEGPCECVQEQIDPRLEILRAHLRSARPQTNDE